MITDKTPAEIAAYTAGLIGRGDLKGSALYRATVAAAKKGSGSALAILVALESALASRPAKAAHVGAVDVVCGGWWDAAHASVKSVLARVHPVTRAKAAKVVTRVIHGSGAHLAKADAVAVKKVAGKMPVTPAARLAPSFVLAAFPIVAATVPRPPPPASLSAPAEAEDEDEDGPVAGDDDAPDDGDDDAPDDGDDNADWLSADAS